VRAISLILAFTILAAASWRIAGASWRTSTIAFLVLTTLMLLGLFLPMKKQ